MTTHPLIKNVMFIDDDEDDYLILREAMEIVDPGIEIYYVENCECQYFGAGYYLPDLIFLDMNMPVTDGFDCLKKIRQSGYREVPVVMYATTKNKAYIEKAYLLGANLFLTKPSKFGQLVDCLSEILKMDWRHPQSITSKYFHDGLCLPLSLSDKDVSSPG